LNVPFQHQFSCLVANIRLHRSIGYTLVQSYFPTGLIVIISWVSFWIDRAAVPARVTLSFSTMLSLTTLGNGLRYGLPQVSYAKAIDFWFGGCMLFVFCSLLEFAVVNSYMRQSERNDKLSGKSLRTKGKKNPDQVSSRNLAEHHLSRKYSSMALSIDKACRYGFPAAFIVWNIAYWSYYLSTER
uniref:Neurotransmitter-gated ion-channel transmembrane domain-containing protein n=1 Tax=Parascaris equorum TaxID=6256 RepID=A0A914R9N7_PAREQ